MYIIYSIWAHLNENSKKTESIHIRIEEKVSLTANRDGGCDDFTLTGMMMLKITDEETSKIKVKLNKDDERAMWQTHPQVDKKKFNSENVIGLKNADRPFPVSKLDVYFSHHMLFEYFRSRCRCSQMENGYTR